MKPWSSEYADKKASEIVRKKNPICVRCKINPGTDCSHFYERGHSSVRFDMRNLDAVCRQCHFLWEGRRNGYKEYKLQQLGKTFIDFQRLAYMTMKREEAILRFMKQMETAQ